MDQLTPGDVPRDLGAAAAAVQLLTNVPELRAWESLTDEEESEEGRYARDRPGSEKREAGKRGERSLARVDWPALLKGEGAGDGERASRLMLEVATPMVLDKLASLVLSPRSKGEQRKAIDTWLTHALPKAVGLHVTAPSDSTMELYLRVTSGQQPVPSPVAVTAMEAKYRQKPTAPSGPPTSPPAPGG